MTHLRFDIPSSAQDVIWIIQAISDRPKSDTFTVENAALMIAQLVQNLVQYKHGLNLINWGIIEKNRWLRREVFGIIELNTSLLLDLWIKVIQRAVRYATLFW